MSERNSPVVRRVTTVLSMVTALSAVSVQAQGTLPPPAGLGVAGAGDPVPDSSFMERQLDFARVRAARDDIQSALVAEFRSRKLDFPPAGIFLRVFKRERIVELWVRPAATQRYTLFRSYPMCVLSGGLGPKRAVGDYQVPEGFYHLTYFNPSSEYLLSLGISYPNRADSLRAAGDPPGGDIFIHGGCRTIGCVPMTDEQIREIYWMAVEARAAGQRVIPVQIFPTRLDPPGLAWLERQYAEQPELGDFWRNLQKGYLLFEETHRLAAVAADARGWYVFGREAEVELAAERERAALRPGAPKLVGQPVGLPAGFDQGDGSTAAPERRAVDAVPAAAPPAESSASQGESIVSSPAPSVRSIAPAPGAPGPPLVGRPAGAGGAQPAADAAGEGGTAAGGDGAADTTGTDGAAAGSRPAAPLAGRPAPFQMRPLEHGLIPTPARSLDDPAAAAGAPGDSSSPGRRGARRGGKPLPALLGRPAEAPPDSTGAGGHGAR